MYLPNKSLPLAKSDLEFYYEVPWEEIEWLLTTPEKVSFDVKRGVRVQFIGDCDLGKMLEERQIDAFFLPHPPHSVVSGQTRGLQSGGTGKLPATRRLSDHACARRSGGAAPAGTVARRRGDGGVRPAKDVAASYYEDPNWSRLALGAHAFEDERRLFGRDPWQNGFRAQQSQYRRFIGYSADQGLIAALLSLRRYSQDRRSARKSRAA